MDPRVAGGQPDHVGRVLARADLDHVVSRDPQALPGPRDPEEVRVGVAHQADPEAGAPGDRVAERMPGRPVPRGVGGGDVADADLVLPDHRVLLGLEPVAPVELVEVGVVAGRARRGRYHDAVGDRRVGEVDPLPVHVQRVADAVAVGALLQRDVGEDLALERPAVDRDLEPPVLHDRVPARLHLAERGLEAGQVDLGEAGLGVGRPAGLGPHEEERDAELPALVAEEPVAPHDHAEGWARQWSALSPTFSGWRRPRSRSPWASPSRRGPSPSRLVARAYAALPAGMASSCPLSAARSVTGALQAKFSQT